MIDWLLSNIGKVITFIIVVYYVVTAIRGSSGEADEPDPEAQERARKIQEEIRRKILERQGQSVGSAPPPVQPQSSRPVILFEEEPEEEYYRPAPRREPPDLPKPRPSSPVAARYESEDDGRDQYARQMQEIEEQLKQAEELRQKALHFDKSGLLGNRRTRARDASGVLRKRITTDLRDQSATRAAIVLKEILDKPVGLR